MKTKSILTTLFLTVSMAFSVSAQDYQIKTSAFGGGGASSGGEFALSGNVETTSARNLSGGNFSIASGFLAGVIVQQTPEAPKISVVRNGDELTLTWTTSETGWSLQSSPTVAVGAAIWSPAPEVVVLNNGQRTVTLTAQTGIRFYRLRKLTAE